MITGLCKLVAKIDFATTQLFWREHLIDGSHASEIVIMMTAYEVDVNDFYGFAHIYSIFVPYNTYMVGYCYHLFFFKRNPYSALHRAKYGHHLLQMI